jgi:hypothetical protein
VGSVARRERPALEPPPHSASELEHGAEGPVSVKGPSPGNAVRRGVAARSRQQRITAERYPFIAVLDRHRRVRWWTTSAECW